MQSSTPRPVTRRFKSTFCPESGLTPRENLDSRPFQMLQGICPWKPRRPIIPGTYASRLISSASRRTRVDKASSRARAHSRTHSIASSLTHCDEVRTKGKHHASRSKLYDVFLQSQSIVANVFSCPGSLCLVFRSTCNLETVLYSFLCSGECGANFPPLPPP